MPNLSDPYLKTIRAKVHLDDLRNQLEIFYKSKPYALVPLEDDIENQRYRVRVQIENVPDHIPLIVGDLLYCLRSALDQLVWSLASLRIDYPKHTQFPIFKALNPGKFGEFTNGVPAKAVKIIDSFQPYHGSDDAAIQRHLLWRLHLLCIIDKHRRIPVHSDEIFFVLPKPLQPFLRFDNTDEMGELSIPLALKRQMTLNPDVSFKVSFGDAIVGIECDLAGIESIYKFVANDVIPRFAPFFPESPVPRQSRC